MSQADCRFSRCLKRAAPDVKAGETAAKITNTRIVKMLVARPKRFELLTPRFVVWCSIQLSYGRFARRTEKAGR
jgi:hypothetical protein